MKRFLLWCCGIRGLRVAVKNGFVSELSMEIASELFLRMKASGMVIDSPNVFIRGVAAVIEGGRKERTWIA